MAHSLLGQIAIFNGRLDEGIALTEREIALNPANAMALYQLGDARVRQAKWDEGIQALQKSIWLNPYYSAPYIVLGRAYMKKGQPATAEGMLTRAIQYDPNNKSAHYLLGAALPADRTSGGGEARVVDGGTSPGSTRALTSCSFARRLAPALAQSQRTH